MHFRRDVAKILREEWQAPQSLAQFTKQIVAWTVHPAPADRGWIGRRNLPELIEAAEVIEAYVVAVLCRPAQPPHPPVVPPRLHHIPAVKRITPALPRLAEEIWRNAGDHFGFQPLIQL